MRPQTAIGRTVSGVVAAVLNQAILGAQAIVLVPLSLRAWGVGVYGQWVALTSIVSYLALIDFGGQTYIGNLLAAAHAQGDVQRFRKVLSEAMSFFLTIGAAAFSGLTLLLAVLVKLGAGRLLLQLWQAEILALLSANILFCSIPFGIYVTAYSATGRYARAAMIGNAQRAITMILIMALLYFRAAPPIVALVTLAVPIVGAIVFRWDSHRLIPGCRRLELSFRKVKAGRAYLNGSLKFWLINVAQNLRQESPVLALALFSGPGAVALYCTHRTVASIPEYVRPLLQGPLTPELTFLWASARIQDLRRVAFIMIRVVVVITGVLAIFLWFTSPTLYPVWTHRELGLDKPLLFVLLAQAVVGAGWRSSTWSLLASNHHHTLLPWFVANGALTAASAAILASIYGPIAVAAAGLASDLILGLALVPLRVSAFFKTHPSRVYWQVAVGMLALIPFCLLGTTASRLLDGFRLVASLTIITCCLAYPMAALGLGRTNLRRLTHLFFQKRATQ